MPLRHALIRAVDITLPCFRCLHTLLPLRHFSFRRHADITLYAAAVCYATLIFRRFRLRCRRRY